jgi:restriction system protein
MFAGSLDGQKASKGVFLTTSTFTAEARQFARSIAKRVVLVDGVELAELMIDTGVGVTTVVTYEVKKVDEDYFEPT